MLAFFIHGVATRDVKYADNLKELIRQEFIKRNQPLPYVYSSFWGDVLSDVDKMWNCIYQDVELASKNTPQIPSEDLFRYQKFRKGFLSEFIGDVFTYFNLERGLAIRKKIAQQLYDFLNNHPDDEELHIIAHSLGSVILWDILFSDRFNAKDPAFYIRSMIGNCNEPNVTRKVDLKTITTMGSPILFVNTMLNIPAKKIREFANSYQRKSLSWINIVHASDIVSYPLSSQLNIDSAGNFVFRDEYIWEDANLAEKAARSVGQVELAMALGVSDAHSSYLNSQKTASLVVNHIMNIKNTENNKLIYDVIDRLEKVRGMTIDTNDINANLANINANFNVLEKVRGMINERNDTPTLATLYSTFKDDSGTIRLFVNKLNVYHVYVFDRNEVCQFGGYVGWLHTPALQEELEFIKRNFCE
ncbi:hypothetical protein NIES2119_06660 [[Phormidium ambiguum] IAM M-71]|uniref:Alpha/beta hydrolase n=1 Tax=[Phormidium ambiguum] IAM M-71 TaxID=454136 RepID=A0A1U7IQ01_9CYAN|nr:hypothetical protein [Phormidium ambiguum]OKH39415.1 hypothetical protein NIES2119_06660 [Phormidium ambiguum IAM M-71]